MFLRVAMLCGVVALLLGAGCSSGSVSTDFDRGYDYSALKSWAFHPKVLQILEERTRPAAEGEGPRATPDQVQLILQLIQTELEAKNLTRVPEEEADFLVALEGKEVAMTKNSYGYGGTYWGRDLDYDHDTVEGTLVVNFVERASDKVVWHGKGDGIVLKPDTFPDAAEKAVKRIFKAYPPR